MPARTGKAIMADVGELVGARVTVGVEVLVGLRVRVTLGDELAFVVAGGLEVTVEVPGVTSAATGT